MSPRRAFVFVLAPLFIAGCGHAPPPDAVTPTAAIAAAPSAAPIVATTPSDAIRRSAIRSVLSAGFGAFLQKGTLDDRAVLVGGKFHGFRIVALQPDFFAGVDLKPGDVVTRIEGMPIEHPEEAIEAFNSLSVASELRVDYERDGAARMLRYRIVDDEGPAPAPKPTK